MSMRAVHIVHKETINVTLATLLESVGKTVRFWKKKGLKIWGCAYRGNNNRWNLKKKKGK